MNMKISEKELTKMIKQTINESFKSLNESRMLDSYKLKDMIYELCDILDEKTGKIMSPGCKDEETGEIRSKVYTVLKETVENLKDIAYDIY